MLRTVLIVALCLSLLFNAAAFMTLQNYERKLNEWSTEVGVVTQKLADARETLERADGVDGFGVVVPPRSSRTILIQPRPGGGYLYNTRD